MADAEPSGSERLWQNGWGQTIALLRIDGDQSQGFRVWFEGPRHGWLFFHLELIGMGEFVCRASHIPNDFLGELVAALLEVLRNGGSAVAASHGEPDTFEFRFTSPPGRRGMRFELVAFPGFDGREAAAGEPVLALGGSGDGVCRAFCWGLRQLQSQVSAEAYQAAMEYPFPTAAVAELGELLGGEFAASVSRPAEPGAAADGGGT
jgi:hypothetical protein